MFTALLVPLLNSQYHDCVIDNKLVECVVNNSRGLVYSRDVVAWLNKTQFNDTNYPIGMIIPLVPPKWGSNLSRNTDKLNLHHQIYYLYCMFENVALSNGKNINCTFKKNKYTFQNNYNYSSNGTKKEQLKKAIKNDATTQGGPITDELKEEEIIGTSGGYSTDDNDVLNDMILVNGGSDNEQIIGTNEVKYKISRDDLKDMIQASVKAHYQNK